MADVIVIVCSKELIEPFLREVADGRHRYLIYSRDRLSLGRLNHFGLSSFLQGVLTGALLVEDLQK